MERSTREARPLEEAVTETAMDRAAAKTEKTVVMVKEKGEFPQRHSRW